MQRMSKRLAYLIGAVCVPCLSLVACNEKSTPVYRVRTDLPPSAIVPEINEALSYTIEWYGPYRTHFTLAAKDAPELADLLARAEVIEKLDKTLKYRTAIFGEITIHCSSGKSRTLAVKSIPRSSHCAISDTDPKLRLGTFEDVNRVIWALDQRVLEARFEKLDKPATAAIPELAHVDSFKVSWRRQERVEFSASKSDFAKLAKLLEKAAVLRKRDADLAPVAPVRVGEITLILANGNQRPLRIETFGQGVCYIVADRLVLQIGLIKDLEEMFVEMRKIADQDQ